MTHEFFSSLRRAMKRSFQHILSYEFRKLMTIIIDYNKQRYHDDGAVYFNHSMTPCILWSVILTVTGRSC